MYNKNGRRVDRRKGPDIWVRSVKYSKYIVWFLAILTLLFISSAKPEIETFFDRLLGISVRKTWNYDLIQRAVYLGIVLYILCAAALIVNYTRKKREGERYSITLIVIGIISFIGVIIYLLSMLT